MEFRLDCACGIPLKVSEAAAGGSVQCLCGRTVPVPQLTELRVRAGLPPYHISPEVLIEHQLASGELPPNRICVNCGGHTEGQAVIVTQCERAHVKARGDTPWIVFLISPLLYCLDRMWRSREVVVQGKDKIYRLPLPVCEACRPQLRRRRAVREWMRRIAVYDQLLDKFPDADLRVE
jgi:hypothetical protein